MHGRQSGETRRHLRYLGILAMVGFVVALAAWLVVSHPKRPVAAGLEDENSPANSTPKSRPHSATVKASPTKTSKPTPTPTPPADAAQVRARVAARIAELDEGQPPGSVSVAALNTATGARYSSGATSGMWTASAYKLFVLETLLLHGQESGAGMSQSEQAQAAPMIEHSDSVAGYDLWEDAGGNPGLESAATRFGMTHTVPGRSDPAFTATSATDCLLLLKNLVEKGPLDADSRTYALGLMRNVESDQRWGVGAVADRGTTFANKNGWLAVDESNGLGEDDDGRWIVTSLGIVTIKGEQVLMAVLTRHQSDFEAGVDLVEQLAKAVVSAVVR